jgi:outer membrane protein assembly factor BamB
MVWDYSANFTYTGTTDTWLKEIDVAIVTFVLSGGGGGGSSYASGGGGAYMFLTYGNLDPDLSYNISVNVGGGGGGAGVGGVGGRSPSGQIDASGGSGTIYSGARSGGGGGATSLFADISGTRIIKMIAGGGGGAGSISGSAGGVAGAGLPSNINNQISSAGGAGGGGAGGGAGGNLGGGGSGGFTGGVNGYNYTDISLNGYFFQGGGGGGGGTFAGGGGGAGYGGGAGGKRAGGGAGGSFANNGNSFITAGGGGAGGSGSGAAQTGQNGYVQIFWNKQIKIAPQAIVKMFMLNAQHTCQSPYTFPFTSPQQFKRLTLTNPYTPVISADREIYIVTGDGYLNAYDHGFTARWQTKDPSFNFIGTPVLGSDSTIYVSAQTVDGTTAKKFFAMVDNSSSGAGGIVKWVYPADSSSLDGNPSVSPNMDPSGNVYFGTDTGAIYKLHDEAFEGTEVWKYSSAGNQPISGVPTFDSSYNFLCFTTTNNTANSTLHVLDHSLNSLLPPTERWTVDSPAQSVFTTPSIRGAKTLYVGTDKGLVYAYDVSANTSLWTVDVHDVSLSAIAIGADKYIYFTSASGLNVVDSLTGTWTWHYPIDTALAQPYPNSIPLLSADNLVYYGGRDGYVYAADAAQRDFRWRWYDPSGGACSAMPVLDNSSNLYVPTHSNNLYVLRGTQPPAPPPPSVPYAAMYMLNPQHTGTNPLVGPSTAIVPLVVEKSGTSEYPFVFGNLFVLPSFAIDASGTLYIGSNDGWVYSINDQGDYTPGWPTQVSDFGPEVYMDANALYTTPALSNGTIYLGSNVGYLHALTPAGVLKWSYYAGAPLQSSPCIDASGTIYFGAGPRVYAVRDAGESGYLKWLTPFTTNNTVNSSPALNPLNGYLYFGSDDGYIYAVDSFTGDLKWSADTGQPIYMSPTVDSSGNVLIGNGSNMDGILGYYDGTTGGSPLWAQQYDLNDGPYYNTVAVHGDTVYLSTISYVYALDRYTGVILWRYINTDYYYSSPVVDASGTVYFTSIEALPNTGDCFLTAVAENDGHEFWSCKIETGGRLAPPVLGPNQTIYLSSTLNKIYQVS